MDRLGPRLDRMLEPVGVDPLEESVYRHLLEEPGAPLGGMARALGTTAPRIRAALLRLETLGLVSRMAGPRGRFAPTPPSVAVEVLVLDRQEQLERTRLAARELDSMYQASRATTTNPQDVVEVVMGPEAVRQRFEQLVKASKERVLVFDTPPYVEIPTGPNELELELLARGLSSRAIYDTAAITVPGRIDHLRVVIEAGEEARTLPSLPMKLFVADDQLAFIPMSVDEPGMEGALLIHPSEVLEALVTLFETLWERAVPLEFSAERASDGGAKRPPIDAELLTLLVAGLKDQSIARQLGVARRTVLRRVAALMHYLGAQTRFQAGWLAAKQE